MLAFAASLCVFLALVTGAVAVFAPAWRRGGADQRVRSLRSPGRPDEPPAGSGPILRRSHSSIPALRRLLGGFSWADDVALQLQQADIHLRVGEYVLVRVLFATLFFLIPFLVLRFHPVGLLIALLAGAVGYFAPAFYVQAARRRRVTKIEKQLNDLLPMLASGLRAGFAFQQAVEVAAEQLSPPVAEELTLLINDVNLGATMENALQDLGRRVGSVDLDMVITAVLVQRTTGGNLSEILDQAGETLRERERIRGDIMTLTAQQRLTGLILSVYPMAVGLLLLALMPSMWSKLFTETLGQVQLGIALGLQLIGFVAIRRMVNIDI